MTLQRCKALVGMLVVVLLTSCQALTPPVAPAPLPGATALDSSRPCGDGVCRGPEDPKNCPTDCTPSVAGSPPARPSANPIPTVAQVPSRADAVLYLGIMVHLEGWEDLAQQDAFERHAGLVREYADLFEAHGGKLTLESKELTDGVLEWGDNVLLEMEQRGHAVGVHADVGGSRQDDCSQMVPELRRLREKLTSLGVRVRHVSGIVSHCDWVAAAAESGYEFVTGVVGYGAMSLPAELRPTEYRDCRSPAACHGVIPLELSGRLHPWRAAGGDNWLNHDPNAPLVILPSSSGLACMHEELSGSSTASCTLAQDDIDDFIGQLDEALQLSAADQVNQFYVSWSLGSPLDVNLLERWLSAIDPYVEAGRVEWKTLPEVYDAYREWERNG